MNQSKIYVGNLPYEATDEQMEEIFGQYGEITEIKLISDFQTGRSKGFGFITFATPEAAQGALVQNDQEFGGRKLRVNIAKEQVRRERR